MREGSLPPLVTCQVSGVTYHMSHVICFFFDVVVKLVGGGSVINECLPHLVLVFPQKVASIFLDLVCLVHIVTITTGVSYWLLIFFKICFHFLDPKYADHEVVENYYGPRPASLFIANIGDSYCWPHSLE